MKKALDYLIDHPVLFVVAATVAVAPISYFMATVGEPRAVWIWRDILGVL